MTTSVNPETLVGVQPRTYNYLDMKIDEYVVPHEGGMKILWVKHGGLNVTIDIDGKRIPLFHADFHKTNDPNKREERFARRVLLEAFAKHYYTDKWTECHLHFKDKELI